MIGKIALGVISCLLLIVGIFWIWPTYNVYSSRLSGEAALAQAQYSERIAVITAQARLDSAQLDAETDIARAKGVAQANKIVADSLGGPEGYLRWKYIEMLQETANSQSRQIIYVPTEANLPILEAGRGKDK